jgi:hypothetical protein
MLFLYVFGAILLISCFLSFKLFNNRAMDFLRPFLKYEFIGLAFIAINTIVLDALYLTTQYKFPVVICLPIALFTIFNYVVCAVNTKKNCTKIGNKTMIFVNAIIAALESVLCFAIILSRIYA